MRIRFVFGSFVSALVLACRQSPDAASLRSASEANEIQGGSATTNAAYNFAVGIVSRLGGVCSGTLIAPNLVLTARHCVVDPSEMESGVSCDASFGPNVAASKLLVTTSAQISQKSKFYAVEEVVTPKAANFCGNDIALMRLSRNVPPTDAMPVTPAVQTDFAKQIAWSKVTALGFGITSPSSNDSGTRRIRQSIDLICIPGNPELSQDCDELVSKSVIAEEEFVTAGHVCQGDSGGGAYEQTSFEAGEPLVIGTVSRGPQDETTCFAAIYTRVDSHADMIIAAAKKAATVGGYPAPSWVNPTSAPPQPASPPVDAGTAKPEKPSASTNAAPDDSALAATSPGSTVTTTTSACAMHASPPTGIGGVFAAGLMLGGLVLRRRRRAVA